MFNHSRDMLDVARQYTHFFAHESCGFCTPCRVGCVQLVDTADRLMSGALAGDLAPLKADDAVGAINAAFVSDGFDLAIRQSPGSDERLVARNAVGLALSTLLGPTPHLVLGRPRGYLLLKAAAPGLVNSLSMALMFDWLAELFDRIFTRLPTALANTSKVTPCSTRLCA